MPQPFIAWIDRDVVEVAGPDATSFLQSLVSQDLDPVPVGGATRALLLQPQGKLIADFTAVRTATDCWWCVCEAGFGATLLSNLERFKIRVKVELCRRDVAALAVRGTDVEPRCDADVVTAPVPWGGAPATDLVGTRDALRAIAREIGLPEVDAAGYERARIEAGAPRLGADIDERTIPQEAGLERDAVSFTKGCFVGQELVCRIDTRGHVNRCLRRLRANAPLPLGAEVVVGDRPVGSITSVAGDVALAMLRREVEPGNRVNVGGTTADVEAIA